MVIFILSTRVKMERRFVLTPTDVCVMKGWLEQATNPCSCKQAPNLGVWISLGDIQAITLGDTRAINEMREHADSQARSTQMFARGGDSAHESAYGSASNDH